MSESHGHLRPLGVFGLPWRADEVERIRAELLRLPRTTEPTDGMLAYLRSGAHLHAPMGPPSADLISGEKDWSVTGHSVWCDGLYFWRGDTADYVARYHLALPSDFLQRGTDRDWRHDERHEPFLLQQIMTEQEFHDAVHTVDRYFEQPFDELWDQYVAGGLITISIEPHVPAPQPEGPVWTPFERDEIELLDDQADLLDITKELRCPTCGRTSVRFYAYPAPQGPPRHPQDLEPERPPSVIVKQWCRHCRHFAWRNVPSEGRTFNDPLLDHVEPDRLDLVRNRNEELFPELDSYWERGLLP